MCNVVGHSNHARIKGLTKSHKKFKISLPNNNNNKKVIYTVVVIVTTAIAAATFGCSIPESNPFALRVVKKCLNDDRHRFRGFSRAFWAPKGDGIVLLQTVRVGHPFCVSVEEGDATCNVYATVKPCLKTLFVDDSPTATTDFDTTMPQPLRQCVPIGKSFLLVTNNNGLRCAADGPKRHKCASASKCMTVAKNITISDTVLYAHAKSSEQINYCNVEL